MITGNISHNKQSYTNFGLHRPYIPSRTTLIMEFCDEMLEACTPFVLLALLVVYVVNTYFFKVL